MHSDKTLLAWLNDAYAMERAQVTTLRNHAADAKNQPSIAAKIEEHLGQTERHSELVKSCIERRGGSVSTVKTAMGKAGSLFAAAATGAAPDELVKNALGDYAAEHFEIACYKSLIAAAEACGDSETARVCEQILREEEDMADWLEANIPTVTQQHLAHTGRSGTATP